MGNFVFTDDERYRKINKRPVHYCFISRKRTFYMLSRYIEIGELNANQSTGNDSSEIQLFSRETLRKLTPFSRDLTIPHLDLSHFALCIMGN